VRRDTRRRNRAHERGAGRRAAARRGRCRALPAGGRRRDAPRGRAAGRGRARGRRPHRYRGRGGAVMMRPERAMRAMRGTLPPIALLAGLALAACSADEPAGPRDQDRFLDDVQARTFRWFWDVTNPHTGLTPDRWPTRSFSSIAAVGFALTAYPIGAE